MGGYWGIRVKKALEPYLRLAPFVGIGLVVAGIAAGVVVFMQRGAHIEVRGSILKVRTLGLEDNSTVAVMDFRLANNSDSIFMVRRVEVALVDEKSQSAEGAPVAEVDAQRLFAAYPALGQKYNETLRIRTKVPPHQTMDRMLVARFEMPEKAVQARKDLRLRIEEVGGAVDEIAEAGK